MSGTVIPGGQRTPAELVDGVTVQEDGSTVEQLANTLNFAGAAVTKDGHGRVTIVTGAGGAVAVDQDGEQKIAAAATLNFTGNVEVTDAGGGVADIAVTSSIDIEENGTPVVAAATAVNFTGSGVTVTDAGGGVAHVAISGGGGGSVAIDQDGTPVVDPASVINFTGRSVAVTDAGGGQADIDIGIDVDQNETLKVTRAKEINFAGDDPITVTVTDIGSGTANVVVGISLRASQNGVIALDGTEDPNNIPVALPVAMSGDYNVQLTYWPVNPATTGALLPFLVSQTDAQNFIIGTTAVPAAGDQIMYAVSLRT